MKKILKLMLIEEFVYSVIKTFHGYIKHDYGN